MFDIPVSHSLILFATMPTLLKTMGIIRGDILEAWGIDGTSVWTLQPLTRLIPLIIGQRYLLVRKTQVEVCKNFSHFLVRSENQTAPLGPMDDVDHGLLFLPGSWE